jgi:hypothetical membrane protein
MSVIDPTNALSDSTRIGALAWLLAAQFFVAQVAVASAWTMPFSLKTRSISDLGNTACGPYPNHSSVIVCSPWHAGMNASFVVVGITMAAGAILARGAFRAGWRRSLAVALFIAAGIGVLMVGIYPENENTMNHLIGAGINFVTGNAALVLFGLALPSTPPRPWFIGFSISAGILGLVSTILFASHHDLGLGPGGIERFAAYTTATWQIVAGAVVLRQG